jgi:hypothetical protein
MTVATTYGAAQAYMCPAGHVGQAGYPLRMIIPGGLDLTPACPACRRPLTRSGGALEGRWRVDECCTPAGPGGGWAGPPRDPAACACCFGTRRHALCLACLAVNCDGDHGEECLACDATGTEDCPDCQGEGRLFDQFGGDAGPCAAGCASGRVACNACGGARTVRPARPPVAVCVEDWPQRAR